MNKKLLGLIGGVLALGLAMPTLGAGDTATAVGRTAVGGFTSSSGEGYVAMTAPIHIAQQKDIHVDISLECNLYTETNVRSKNKVTGTKTASANVAVKVNIYDSNSNLVVGKVYPAGWVNFCGRDQTLSAQLQGFIDNLACFDPILEDGSGGDFDPTNDGCNLEEEQIGLILDTWSANAFNFVIENLESDTYTVEAEVAIIDDENVACNFEAGTQCSSSTATVRTGVMILDEIRLGNNVKL